MPSGNYVQFIDAYLGERGESLPKKKAILLRPRERSSVAIVAFTATPWGNAKGWESLRGGRYMSWNSTTRQTAWWSAMTQNCVQKYVKCVMSIGFRSLHSKNLCA